MEFRVLGPMEAVRGGQVLPVKGRQRRLLLATLLLHRNQVVSVDHLIDVLFGDHPPERAGGTVQSYVSRLRHDLGGGDDLVQTRTPGYVLVVEDGDLDASRFQRQVASVGEDIESDPLRSRAVLEGALSLWRGPAFSEFVDDLGLAAEKTRLDETRQRALEQLADTHLALDDAPGAIALLETCIADRPLRESFRAKQMLALYRCGRHPEAVRAYQRFHAELSTELGLQPSTALANLEKLILQQDPSLDRRPPGKCGSVVPPPLNRAPVPDTGGGPHVPLPLPLNTFIGRDEDLRELGELLSGSRMVTLTGPGGVGKTRLALRLAEANADRFSDGVWLCDLAAIREPSLAVDAVTTALDVQRHQDSSTLDSLIEVLRPRQLLVVLDNCEHVLASIGDVAEVVLRACPNVTLLATSREPLAVEGERVWIVRPLGLPVPAETDLNASLACPSVRLFVDRATSAHSQFKFTQASVAAVIEICRRLDGIPLAIELAAARVRSMTVTDVSAGLDERFRLLTSGRRSEPRHQTLLAAVEWSYDLLDATEQALFCRLAVFAGSFTREDVEQVCSDDTMSASDARARLPALVDKSMVAADTGSVSTRYSLLETLREFGRQRMDDDGTAGDLQDNHTRHFVSTVEHAATELDGPGETRSSVRFDHAFDDLRIAFRRALRQGDRDVAMRLVVGTREYALRSIRYELFTWAEAVLSATLDPLDHPLTSLVLAVAAYGRFVRGELESAMTISERSLAVERDMGLPSCGLNLRTMGNVLYYQGRTDEAADVCRRMTQAARESGDNARLVHALYMSSVGQTSAGRTDESCDLAEEALRVAEQIDNPTALASARYAQAMTLEVLDPPRAASILEAVSAHGAVAGNRWIVAFAKTELASLAARRGELDQALRLASDVIDTWYRGGDWANQWLTLRHVAGVFAQRGDHIEAATLHGALRVASAEQAMPIEASDMRRLVVMRDVLPDALGPTRLADADAVGSSMSGDAVVGYARQAIAGVLGD
jgi:predicted ATPase/DNA-binding SARP family transcriptional activator